MPSVLRILDANANRAREALRVMEEAARFILNDASLAEPFKQLRHDLAAALAPLTSLEANRDTPRDVGTAIKAPGEARRESVAQVALAAGKRLSEALRAIEEYAKTLGEAQAPGAPGGGPALAAAVEALRYRGYDLEQRLGRALAPGRSRQWRLCVLLTESRCVRPWGEVLHAVVEAGADCVQLREKAMDAGPLLERTRQAAAVCRPRGVSVVVNDRPDVALLAGADGVHLGQTDLPCAEARRLVGRQLIIGVSTSSLEQAQAALRDGADYCGVGPMFPTSTKHKDVIVGPAYLRAYLAWGKLPHLAIGGVTPDNYAPLAEAGVGGVAVSAVVCGADDPAAVVRRFVEIRKRFEPRRDTDEHGWEKS